VSAEFANQMPTLGLYYADYSSDDVWYLGNNMVLAAGPNSTLVNFTLDNGVQVTRNGASVAPRRVQASRSSISTHPTTGEISRFCDVVTTLDWTVKT
jgi:hypothetical protein